MRSSVCKRFPSSSLVFIALPLAILPCAQPATASMTPVIGVDPAVLDFGIVTVGECDELPVELYNAGESGTLLEITDLSVDGNAMSLIDPPDLPLMIPTGGVVVPITVRACALLVAEGTGTLIVTSGNAPISPVEVPILIFGNRRPVCVTGEPYTAGIGDPISFDGSASHDIDGTIENYAWEFGDGGTGAAPTESHTYDAAGTFTVTLCVTDDRGAQNCCSTTAEIDPGPPPPVCDAGGPYAGVVGIPLLFDGSGSSSPMGTIVSYAWQFGDGSTGEGVTPSHVYAPGGVYTVSLVVIDNEGAGSSCSATADIDSSVPPHCDAGGLYRGDAGNTIQFDGTGSSDPDGTIVEYAWSFGDGDTGSGATPTHVYDAAGNFTVTLCVTDDEAGRRCCETAALVLSHGGGNGSTAFILHALLTEFGPCEIPDPCPYEVLVDVPAGVSVAIYLIVRNYNNIAGVQTAFDFGNFTLLYSLWDCQSNQVSGHVPEEPGGATDGTLATAFDCIAGGVSQPIGRLHFLTGSSCVTQVESSFPFETHVIDCETAVTPVIDANRGAVCVGYGGVNTCDPSVPAVEETSWGRIKARFR